MHARSRTFELFTVYKKSQHSLSYVLGVSKSAGQNLASRSAKPRLKRFLSQKYTQTQVYTSHQLCRPIPPSISAGNSRHSLPSICRATRGVVGLMTTGCLREDGATMAAEAESTVKSYRRQPTVLASLRTTSPGKTVDNRFGW